MNGKLTEKLRAIMTIVLCALAAVGIALFITVNLSPLFIHFPSAGIRHLTRGQICADYWHLLAYLELPWVGPLQLQSIPLTSQAVTHFRDVRHLLLTGELVGGVSLVLAVWLLDKQKRQGQLWRLLSPLKWSLFLIVMFVWIPLINFSTDFVAFHRVLFANQDWLFSPRRDPIILLMPEQFFWHLFMVWLVITILLMGSLWGWLMFVLGFSKFRTNKTNNRRDQGYHDDRQDDD
ncbi:MAG: TIGR01906 family membrane protein [Lactobacillaceae bacterium]|nr:TIGR01906 family membrane protein [Lactobacillaceae bacterium]